jgi:hypothetical protein
MLNGKCFLQARRYTYSSYTATMTSGVPIIRELMATSAFMGSNPDNHA